MLVWDSFFLLKPTGERMRFGLMIQNYENPPRTRGKTAHALKSCTRPRSQTNRLELSTQGTTVPA
jgi:hypothetical protein